MSIEYVVHAGKCSEDRVVKQNRQNSCFQGDYVLVGSQCLIKEESPTHLQEENSMLRKNRHLILARLAKDFGLCSCISVD